jgi:hypothetical protein
MALTSILAPAGDTAVFVFARGNGGVLSDIVAKGQGMITLPSLGGSCTYPSENDVQDGVTFGDIYTGTLVVPAEADVLTGVGYGANGTEFTGEATAGGGEHSVVF